MSGFPETEADLRRSLGNFRGSLGNFRGTPEKLPGNPWIAVEFHSERTSGEVASKLPGKFGETSSRLELSISKNTPHRRWGQGPGGVDPRFPAGLPFPVPEILEFAAFRDSGKIFQQFSRDFPGVVLGNPEQTPETATAFSSFLIYSPKAPRNATGVPTDQRKSL